MTYPDAFLDGPRRIIAATLVVAAVIAGFAAAYFFSGVLFSLFVGAVLATALKPIIEGVQRCGIRQQVAVGAVYAWVALFLITVITVGAGPAIDRSREVAGAANRAGEEARNWLAHFGDAPWANVARRLVDGRSLDRALAEPEQSLATVGWTASYVTMVARGLLAACMVVLLAFYWSLQGDRTVRWLLLLLPVDRRDAARDTMAEIEAKVGAYLRGQGVVCLAMGVMAAVVYGLLGLPHAITLGLVAGLLEVMPVLGPLIGALPPLMIAAFNDPGKTPWVLAAAIIMQQIEGYLIVPRIMDKSVGVHPLVTLLAIAAFGSLLGIGGAILAIPLAAIVQVLLNRYVLVPTATGREPPTGRDALSVLHYDVQNLLGDIRMRDKAELPAGDIGRLSEVVEAMARELGERLKTLQGGDETEGRAMTRLAKTTACILATLLGLAALWELGGAVLVFLISLIVAAAARAPVDYLIGRGQPKWAAVAGTYVASLLSMAVLTLAAISLVSGELGQVTDDFKRLYDYLANHSSSMPWLQRAVNERLPAIEELLATVVGNHGEQAAKLVLGTAFGFLGAVVDVVFVIVLSIYWTIDREYFERLWLALLPLPHRVSARNLWRILETELGAYARSEIAQSVLAGIVLGAGFYLLGLKYPVLLALVAALSWLVPWLGVIIALVALAVVELPVLVLEWPGSLLPVAVAAIFTAAVFMMLEFGVEPRLFNRRRYNSLFIVLAVMALTENFGILGLLLGPMVAVAVQAAVEHIERERITLRAPLPDMAVLDDHIAEARALAASEAEAPRREWLSILDRLAALLARAREIEGESP